LDKFPEAFERFERVRNVDEIRSFRQLEMEIAEYMGEKWRGTSRQLSALAVEAQKRGIPLTIEKTGTWKHEIVIIRRRGFNRFRDLRTGRFIRKP
jgi:hypothetical protein